MPSSRSDQPAVAVAAVPATWDSFVDRFGITMAVGLLTAIDATIVAYNAGLTPPDGATALQLLLVMIMLGCIAVLSFRDGHRTKG